ncbi:MAG: DUF2815 family protein [Acutalibacter sp.]|nr:DUF2815 family protein [Acutalibacter sp.]
MADKATTPTKVITGKCRLSFEHIWKPSKMDEDSQAKYSASIIIPKTDSATLTKIKAAQEAAVKDGIQSKWEGKKPAKLKLPLRDGDEDRPDDSNYTGCYFLNASSNNKPGIVDLSRQEITDEELVYSGCYCRFSLNFYPFSVRGNKGVAAGLNNIQKVCDGERLGGGGRAEDDFDDDFVEELLEDDDNIL